MRVRPIKRQLISHDPRRRAILARIRLIWRQLPPEGVLLFFDERVITVKAYGGWSYTAAKRLTLERAQKTRGKLYLFGLYEVNTGRRRWAFYEHKCSDEICQFMRQIRR